jgi:hypothetical protein
MQESPLQFPHGQRTYYPRARRVGRHGARLTKCISLDPRSSFTWDGIAFLCTSKGVTRGGCQFTRRLHVLHATPVYTTLHVSTLFTRKSLITRAITHYTQILVYTSACNYLLSQCHRAYSSGNNVPRRAGLPFAEHYFRSCFLRGNLQNTKDRGPLGPWLRYNLLQGWVLTKRGPWSEVQRILVLDTGFGRLL